jgi:hypothetical protein
LRVGAKLSQSGKFASSNFSVYFPDFLRSEAWQMQQQFAMPGQLERRKDNEVMRRIALPPLAAAESE